MRDQQLDKIKELMRGEQIDSIINAQNRKY